MTKKIFLRVFLIVLVLLFLYGLGRLYFHLTAGFTLSNIASNFAYQERWEVRPLESDENKEMQKAISQTYKYLGKGCQSYVFLSDDGQYVIKFFKYQRFRLQPWLKYFPPLPAIVKYRQEKIEKKEKKLDGFVLSWKTAFENLKDETGLIYVHLNKTDHLQKSMKIYDKIGFEHVVYLDKMEFCIQRSAEMICQHLLKFKNEGNLDEAKVVINKLLDQILSEYDRGLGDSDHALMQNTGVANGQPIHIDVGQFSKEERFKDPGVYKQELFTKTYKFKVWLKAEYPELEEFLEERLSQIIGTDYTTMKPKFRK